MKKVLFVISLAGWSLSVIIVLATFFDINLEEKVQYIFFHVFGGFILSFFSLFFVKHSFRYLEWEYDNDYCSLPNRISITPFIKGLSNWIYVLIGFSFFAAFVFILHHGSVDGMSEVIDGKYFMTNARGIVREIDENEYHKNMMIEIRILCGFGMMIYWTPILIFKKLIKWEIDDIG
ncbi:hypothetical protein SAMN06298216_3425 [Spirosomataceae bacterium TFI 002]|nr:hypothetical protein SAMN06298216_3425 [Spirosomataceae bacterium TFI 002]